MSYYLHQLLDLRRLADCARHDAIQFHPSKEATMRHCTASPKREYATIETRMPAPREFEITVMRPGETESSSRGWFVDATEAAQSTLPLLSGGAICEVRPVIECTELEGRVAYPRPLHRDAKPDAQLGWKKAAQRRYLDMRRIATVHAAAEVEATLWGAA